MKYIPYREITMNAAMANAILEDHGLPTQEFTLDSIDILTISKAIEAYYGFSASMEQSIARHYFRGFLKAN